MNLEVLIVAWESGECHESKGASSNYKTWKIASRSIVSPKNIDGWTDPLVAKMRKAKCECTNSTQA